MLSNYHTAPETPAIYCWSTTVGLNNKRFTTYVSPLLWSALNEIPAKIAAFESFEVRLSNIVTAALFHLNCHQRTSMFNQTCSVSLLVSGISSERQEISISAGEADQSSILIGLAQEEHQRTQVS